MKSLAELQVWSDFRAFTRGSLNKLPDSEAPIYITVDSVDFDAYSGNAVFFGARSTALVRTLRKEGLRFKEGTCSVRTKQIHVDGVSPGLLKLAGRTMKKLSLGFELASGGGDDAEANGDDRERRAWAKLKAAQLPALQKAIAADSPHKEQLEQLVTAAEKAERAGRFEVATKAFAGAAKLAAQSSGAGAGASAFAKRKAALAKEIKAAIGDGGARAEQIKKAVERMNGFEAANQFPQAQKVLERIEEILQTEEDGEAGELPALEQWDEYRVYMRTQFKKMGATPGPIYLSKKPRVFKDGEAEFRGSVVLVGPKAMKMVRKLKKEQVLFLEYACRPEGKTLVIDEVEGARLKLANRTLKRLKLGFVAKDGQGSTGEDVEASPPVDPDVAGARTEYTNLVKALTPALREALQADGAHPNLRDQMETMQATAKAGRYDDALARARELEATLGQAGEDDDGDVELESLENWDQYTAYMKSRLKKVKAEPTFFFVSKKRNDFVVGDSTWKGLVVLAGRKSDVTARKLKKTGIQFLEGTCTREGKQLQVDGLPVELVRRANKTLVRLKLGYRCLAVGDTGEDEDGSFEERYAALEPRLREALQRDREQASTLRTRFGMAREVADAGDVDRATAILDRLEPLIDQILGASGAGAEPGGGLVAYRQALLAFRSRRSEIANGLTSLLRAIPAKMPAEAELAEELVEQLQGMYAQIDDAIDGAINAAQSPSEPVPAAVRARIESCLADVQSDPLIRHVDANPFVPLTIGKTLRSALSDIRAKMPA